MENLYYFKFVVPSHYEISHNTYKQAVKTAKKLKESIYLIIYHKKNICKEPYAEIELGLNESNEAIITGKNKLIDKFQKWINE